MRRNTIVIALSTLFAFSGCVGDVNLGPGQEEEEEEEEVEDIEDDQTNQRTLFEETVSPILTASCGDAGCHGVPGNTPIFVVGGVADYDTVISDQDLIGGFEITVAKIVTRVDEGHYDVVYATAERAAIEFWIREEKAIRGGDLPDVEPTSLQALEDFAGCMTLANWNQAEMGDWADHRAGGVPCRSCHAGCGAGFCTSGNNELMFNQNRQYNPIAGIQSFLLVEPDPLTGDPVVKIAESKMDIMSDGGGPGSNHDSFNYGPGNSYYQRLLNFYDLTVAEMAANPACMDIGFYDPAANL